MDKRHPYCSLSSFQENRVVHLYTQKENPIGSLELAEKFGVSKVTILTILRAHGVEIRGRGKPKACPKK